MMRNCLLYTSCSEEVAAQIDAELKKQLVFCMDRAKEILQTNMQKLHEIAKVLMEKEKISGEEFEEIFERESIFSVQETT